jgi:hypothetical protein
VKAVRAARRIFLLHARWRIVLALLALASWSDALAQLPSAAPPEVKEPAPEAGLARWFNPATAPFIPVPLIGTDPDSGTTLGVLPTIIVTDENHEITRIIAPDIQHNPYFGWGAHGRIFAYPSEDKQWSLMAGIKQRVEREFDGEFQYGRLRTKRWSFTASAIYDRDGTPRFFGLGNRSAQSSETNYTSEQEVVQLQAGYNISKIWQLLYTARARQVDVLPGTLSGVPSIQELFPHARGIGRYREALNRISLVYNTMDNLTVPSHGMQLVEYTGIASRAGLFNDSLYTEAGFDGRGYFPVGQQTVIAAHLAVRYLLSAKNVPFWALSSLGGDRSEIGGEQLLRGFGAGRYYDRNSLSMSAEVRRHVVSFNAISTRVDLEVAPFVDLGRVFGRLSTMPFTQLHHVYGIGFRGIARPFVVGYVDVGYGSNGVAVFTGISYPF